MAKLYYNLDTGMFWTLEEVKEAYTQQQGELKEESFEEHLEMLLRLGRDKVGGLVEVEQQFYFVHTCAYDSVIITASDTKHFAVYFTDDGSESFPHSIEEAKRMDLSNVIGATADELDFEYSDGTNCGTIEKFDPADLLDGETTVTAFLPES